MWDEYLHNRKFDIFISKKKNLLFPPPCVFNIKGYFV